MTAMLLAARMDFAAPDRTKRFPDSAYDGATRQLDDIKIALCTSPSRWKSLERVCTRAIVRGILPAFER